MMRETRTHCVHCRNIYRMNTVAHIVCEMRNLIQSLSLSLSMIRSFSCCFSLGCALFLSLFQHVSLYLYEYARFPSFIQSTHPLSLSLSLSIRFISIYSFPSFLHFILPSFLSCNLYLSLSLSVFIFFPLSFLCHVKTSKVL